MLELAILGLLKERSMHGYQLSKRLTDTLGGFWRVSYGSLYPTLRRLERDGAVERVFDGQEVGRRRVLLRGQPVPGSPGVLQVPSARYPDPIAGATAGLPRGTALDHHRVAHGHPRALRHIHA